MPNAATTLEREIYIVLSTAHLSEQTVQALPGLPVHSEHSEFRIRFPLIAHSLQNVEPKPDDLKQLFAFVRENAPDAYGIVLDCDGPLAPQLPFYEW